MIFNKKYRKRNFDDDMKLHTPKNKNKNANYIVKKNILM